MRRAESRSEEETPSRSPSVLAVVVTHRGREWLRECLVGLNTQTYSSLDVLVVDDASPDFRTQPHLKRIVKRHLTRRRWGFLRTPRPLGFGGAINWALSRVRTDADFLLFVHDDAALDRDAVEDLITRIVADDKLAVVGPKIVSWDDPQRLEEVGMAVDRFGYPYKGLEEGEIDLGQHDSPNEVFYVTSTCMLVRHDAFRALKGFDARMRAFSEDLDLCWRARVAGHAVRVEPRARARHAMALATGRRPSKFLPARYFIRRNRLRAIAKNASSPRLVSLLPQFFLLAMLEMLGFIVLRQPREIVNLARALAWNLLNFPQTLSERARVQRLRSVPDRRLNRLTVRQATRMRVYVAHQADRLEETWGRRAEIVARQTTQVRAFGSRVGGRPLAAAGIVLVAALVGWRHLVFETDPIAIGDLLPFPNGPTGLWRSFGSPWQASGLGQQGASPPGFLLMGVFSVAALGASLAAQKLLVIVLGVAAFAGMVRLTAEVVDRPARYVGGLVYLFGAVGYAGVGRGEVGALVFGAAAPFVVHSLLRLLGWVRPPAWDGGREAAHLVLGLAVSAAFVPGALFLYAAAAAVLGAIRAVFVPRLQVIRSLAAFVGLAGVAWGLLLPWSATWLSAGAPLDRLWGERTSGAFVTHFSDHGMLSVLTGQTPDGPALFGLALPLTGVLAVLLADGQRRRVALAMWAVVISVGWIVAAISEGMLRPLVSTPTEAGVLAAVAFSALAAIAVAAFRVDLPRRGLGWIHALGAGGLALAAFLVAAGLLPAMWRGEWAPGGEEGRAQFALERQIGSLLGVEALEAGTFRVLWIGDRWTPDNPSALRPLRDYLVTGAKGRDVRDLFERGRAIGERELERVVTSVQEATTDRGGSLLGAFNIAFVVVDPGADAEPWLVQRDLSMLRSEEDFILLENASRLPRAGIYNSIPSYVRALDEDDPTLVSERTEVRRAVARRVSPSAYAAGDTSGPGEVFLAETSDERWEATLRDEELARIDVGWGNAFELPETGHGRLVVSLDRSVGEFLALGAVGLGWVVTLGAAFSTRRRARRGPPAAGAAE